MCEKCGAIFAIYWDQQLENAVDRESRLDWDKFWAGTADFFQLALMPLMSVRGLLRSLVVRLISLALSKR